MIIRFKVVLELRRKTVGQLLTFAQNVVDRINANGFFAVPHPALAAISDAIADLTTAAANAVKAGVLQTTILKEKRIALENLLTECGHYVEDVANDPANAVPLNQPVEIIESAGMTVKRVPIRQPRVFGAKAGSLPGTAKLVAARAIHGVHEWEFTQTPADPDSWVAASPTSKASTIIIGLNSVAEYYFRHRAFLPVTGYTPWDDPVSAVIN